MLGYVTKKEALSVKMTHHGSYYGIPLWLAPEHPDFLVWAKWQPMEIVLTVFHHIEGFMRSILFPDDEPVFQFKIGNRIDS